MQVVYIYLYVCMYMYLYVYVCMHVHMYVYICMYRCIPFLPQLSASRAGSPRASGGAPPGPRQRGPPHEPSLTIVVIVVVVVVVGVGAIAIAGMWGP